MVYRRRFVPGAVRLLPGERCLARTHQARRPGFRPGKPHLRPAHPESAFRRSLRESSRLMAEKSRRSRKRSPSKIGEVKGKKTSKKPTLAHRAEFYTMRATLRALRFLSWDSACAVGEQLGALGYKPLGIRKHVVERQIAAAFPNLT